MGTYDDFLFFLFITKSTLQRTNYAHLLAKHNVVLLTSGSFSIYNRGNLVLTR